METTLGTDEDLSRATPAFASPVVAARDTARTSGTLVPVILLGGEANALSVLRSLGRIGVTVYYIGEPDSTVRHSRYARCIDLKTPHGLEDAMAAFLLGPDSAHLDGAIVLACSDAGLTVVANHHEALSRRDTLDEANPAANVAMLDKLATLQIARAAGVATPLFWSVASREDVLAVKDELVYPLLVKPRLSHLFQQQFGVKHITANCVDEILSAFDAAKGAGMEMLLTELIPGGDDQLCSYFTYLDERSRPLYHFTKRVFRRYPAGMGAATYHITDWVPELVEPANKLFSQAKLRGLANVEFKRDHRDGQYKLIECNARFVASDGLVKASGLDQAAFVYSRLTGRPTPPMTDFRRGLRMLDPIRDFWAFRELSGKGKLSLLGWLASICHRQTFAYMAWSDPKPFLDRMLKPLTKRLRR